MFRLTVQERVLLHLVDFAKYGDELEVPPAMTQEGVAQAAWIDVPHFAQYVRPLIRKGLVRERAAHVRRMPKRRKVYDLTAAGKMEAVRLRERIKAEVVRVRDEKGVREASVSRILAEAGRNVSLLQVVRQAIEGGVVDLRGLAAAPVTAFVEAVSDAPMPRTFVGRSAELDSITGEDEAPRLFVVRGMAGIGKSSLGAKAIELLRGKRNLFWHRIRPWDTIPSILASLGSFLSALGKPGLSSVLSRGETSRAADVLQEDLPGTKAFLVFDDAHEASEEAMPFFRALKDAVTMATDVRTLILTRRALSFYDRRDVVITGLVAEIDLAGLGAEDVAALVASEPDAAKLAEFGQQVGGHPLFLELVKARGGASAEAVRDMHRFIREEIYERLSGDERVVMKTGSLYGVAVPSEALVAAPGLSHDVLFSLSDRALIRPVGRDLFEVHDTIRDFFADVTTSVERKQIAAFAVAQLRRLASEAYNRRDFVDSIHYLSNALQLSESPTEETALWEALGDAKEGIGDLPAALAAYRESARATKESEALARLHRKMAWALEDRGEHKAASAEIEEGVRALGLAMNAERGWLDLLRCSVATANDEWDEGREHGEAALRTFQSLHVVHGEAEALLALGSLEAYRPQEDVPLAERYFRKALEVSGSVADPVFAARLHYDVGSFYAYVALDLDKANRHLAAIEAMPEAMGDPRIRRFLLFARGNFYLLFRADYRAAEADYVEAISVARKLHDATSITSARFQLASSSYYQGKIEHARHEFEEVAAEMRAQGDVGGALGAMLNAAECCLLEEDLEGFNKVVGSLDDPEFARGVEINPSAAHILRGIDRLIRGDREGCRTAFEEALRLDETSVKAPALFSSFFYGIALRVMGDEQEAARYIGRFVEGARKHHRKARLSVVHDRERRLTEVLRRASKTQS